MNYWLMKCEPSTYSFDDLKKEKRSMWEGVRNYQARNFMRDQMKKGDLALFYHSNATPPGVVGICRICKESYPDHTAWDPKSKYFDPRSTPEKPLWFMVDVEYVRPLKRLISLTELKAEPKLKGMMVLQKGSRLSIQPISKEHFQFIEKMT